MIKRAIVILLTALPGAALGDSISPTVQNAFPSVQAAPAAAPQRHRRYQHRYHHARRHKDTGYSVYITKLPPEEPAAAAPVDVPRIVEDRIPTHRIGERAPSVPIDLFKPKD